LSRRYDLGRRWAESEVIRALHQMFQLARDIHRLMCQGSTHQAYRQVEGGSSCLFLLIGYDHAIAPGLLGWFRPD
jgi:hypothetical protein